MTKAISAMTFIRPATLRLHQVRLEPLCPAHEGGLRAATQDGALWRIAYASAPEPDKVGAYIQAALHMAGRLAFAVIDEESGAIVGSTGFHDMDAAVKRVCIGYTWYAHRVWRSRVNTACKLMLLTHAFDTSGCRMVAWHTDILNLRSQAAIERLGAHQDGVIRGNRLRRDGSVRDTVMYSMSAQEWTTAKKRLMEQYDEYHRAP